MKLDPCPQAVASAMAEPSWVSFVVDSNASRIHLLLGFERSRWATGAFGQLYDDETR